jgi:hypothetical protein
MLNDDFKSTLFDAGTTQPQFVYKNLSYSPGLFTLDTATSSISSTAIINYNTSVTSYVLDYFDLLS